MAKKIYNDLINPQIKPNDLDLSMFNKPDELDLSMFDSVKKNEDSDSTSEVRVSASKESTSIDFNAPPPAPKFEKEALGQPPVDEQSVDYLTPEQTKRRTDTVSALKEQLPFIQKTIADIDEKAKVNIGGNVLFGFGKEQGDLLTARRYLKSAEKLINSPTEEGIKSFWAGLKRNDLTNLLSLGSTEAYRAVKTANIANKIKNGEEPTDEEYLVLTGRFMYDIANQNIDSPSSYRIGQAFAEMAPFIGQLYVSAPVGSAASKAAASTTSKVLSKEVVNVLKKYGIDDVLKTATQAAAQTPFTPMLFQKYGEERMPSLSVNDEGKVIPVEGGESRVEAVADAFGSTVSSIFSEKVGEVIKGRVTNWGKKAAIAMDDPSKALSSIQKFRKDANWSGLGYEFAEEQIDGVGQAITTEEATLSDLLDSKRQFETLATIMVAGGVMKAVEIPGYFKTKQYKKDLDKATEYFRSKVDPHTAEVVDAAVNTDDVDQMRERLQNEDLSYLQPEQQKDVLDYMKAKIENNVLFEAANTKLEKDENGKVIKEKEPSEDITPPKEDNAPERPLESQEIEKNISLNETEKLVQEKPSFDNAKPGDVVTIGEGVIKNNGVATEYITGEYKNTTLQVSKREGGWYTDTGGYADIPSEFMGKTKEEAIKNIKERLASVEQTKGNEQNILEPVQQDKLEPLQGEQVPESKEPVQEVKTDPEIAIKLRDFAAKIRQGKISKIEGFKANTPFSLAWDGALEVLATTLDTTADITVAVNKAMIYIKETDWYKGLSHGRRKEFEDKFIDHINKESGLVTEGEPRVSGIKKSLVPQEMVDATDVDRKSNIEMLERGKQLIESGEIDGTTLVQDIVKKPRALQQEEVASLVYYKAKLDNSFDEVYDKWEAAKNSDNVEQQQEMQVRLDAIRKQIDDYHEMSLQTAYEQSRAFGLRKMLLDNEYTLQTQVKKYKAANNGEIPVEVEQKFRDYEKQLEEVNKKLRDLERRKMETEGNDVLQAIKRSAGRPTRKQGKALAAEGFQDLMQALGAMKMAAQTGEKSVTVVDALGKIGRGLIDEGVATLENVIAKIKDYITNNYKGDLKYNIDDISDDIMKSIREYKGKPEIVDGKLKMPKDIVRDYVEQGYDDINEIVSAIKNDFQLEATDREIRDAITEYGKTLKMSQEDIYLKVRELKRMGKTISGLEDVKNEKRKPLRSGLQRDKLTDRERRLQKELREAMKELPLSEEESLAEWKSALDAVKSRLRNQIEDLQHQIETGEKAPSRKGIEYDAEAEALREQRDALKETLEELMGKEEISDEQKVRMALASTERWITEYERRISEKDFSPLSQRRNVPMTEELEAAKKRLADAKKAYKDMLDIEGETDKRRLARYKDAIFRQTTNYAKRLREKDFAPRQKVEPPKADRDALELLALKTKIKEKFDTEVEKARLANRPLSAKINETLIDVANLPKSLIASADLSAPLRQGVILGAAHPTKVPGAFKEMFLQAFSSKRADKWLNHIKVNPDFHIIRQSKLYISEDSTRLRAKEEQFMTNIGHKIPIWGRVVSGSERAYTGYLNKLRVDVFLQGVDHLKKQRLDPTKDSEAYKAWADFVNNASGRGNLGILEGAAPVLNATFFSPRLIASRFNLLNPVKYINMPTEVRKMALRDMGIFIGFGVMVLAIAKASGAEVEDDPRSSDFGKIKIGNLRFDVWAGFQQPVVMFSRLATGETKSSTSGKIRELSPKEYPFTTRADVVRRFFRSKMSPTAALSADLLQGETMMGEELDAGKMALERVIPLYLQDMKEIKDELGVKGMVGAGIPSLFGVGVQYYEPKPSKTNK